MRFLVTAESVEYGGPTDPKYTVAMIENLIIPSFQILEKWEKEGKIVGGNLAGLRSGAFIVEVSSHEELGKMLSQLPFWGQMKWSVAPIISMSTLIAQTKENVQSMKAMIASMH